MSEVLRLEGISRRFGALAANDAISLTLHRGELLALLGENGAGKTTLMNILFGLDAPDAGRVIAFGQVVPPGQPRAAIARGIGMVQQHFALADNLSVLDNVMAGTEPLTRLWAHRAAGRRKLAMLSARFGLAVAEAARVGDLSVGERQRVEILKALYRNSRILILDEPTAVLTRAEAVQLYATLRGMAAQGLSLIFITHKLQDVLDVADRVVVLRAGRVVAERRRGTVSRDELAELMVGRRLTRPQRNPPAAHARLPGEILLQAAAVDAGSRQQPGLQGVSFTVRAGEILGVIGVAGNGQSTLAALVFGLCAPRAGVLRLFGSLVRRTSPRALVAAGVARVPEDRHAQGAIGEMTLWENAVLERLRRPAFSTAGLVRRAAARRLAADIIAQFDVRGGAPDRRMRLLSGGNMQKFILGRSLLTQPRPRLLLVAQPTRGLDEAAVAEVHTALLAARDHGAGILLISEDLDEILALADQVQAIVGGRLSPPIAVTEATPARVGLMMAGA